MVRIARITAAALAMTASVTLTACGGDDAPSSTGSPGTPQSTSDSPSGDVPPTTSGSAKPGKEPLLDLDPCTMISAAEVRAAGITKKVDPDPMSGGSSTKICTWGEIALKGITLTLRASNPEGAQPMGTTPGPESTVDGRRVLRYTTETRQVVASECTSVIVVSPRSYVKVQFADKTPMAQICAQVDRLVTSISTKLPR
ncbi:uncharacterized protein DUF3558 [Herbihabitans rhizosphaerae]|uniref:Uncharacterized protein DUF3558 n=1 Tax=Herbihabitans rhizosphaerae TaxID=1872711 RepID=A0A4Q7KHJ7_9PSEU|nr:DUF3558 domain-containing protein [Herbihabitans rhizosphaerae]RZS32727.1 uncharacterized protein DUF3558 [Herbihabitans rhizosphaerae]